ncbi:hypothetical protein [Marinibactrum halimedae]|uniref:Uncharacterized protein n=1 Tax=Marinibactrum halimedae TaxID=1444977 RepID=A0AA37WPP0_9GAMM|nr:hypothetical protein [Marinibactrum halimedae]MCD9461352.1 hypothetical protein [Marinibactrum halimedae]GLS26407.1 hypothetical protein GCM10007877_21220 [Marinibactrum halimedae]
MPFGTFKNPKGPSWKNPEKIELGFSGTSVIFLLPVSNANYSSIGDGDKLQFGKSSCEIDIDKKVKEFGEQNNLGDQLKYDYRLKRMYDFKGMPLIGTEAGGLTFRLAIIYGLEKNFLNGGFFDGVLARMDRLHGKEATKNFLIRLYPINWSLIELGGCNALSYGVEDLMPQPREVSAFRFHFVLPISSSAAMDFQFDFDDIPVRSGGIESANVLIKKVMESLVVDYKAEHKVGVKSLNLKESFTSMAPLVWKNYKKVPRVDYNVLEKYL